MAQLMLQVGAEVGGGPGHAMVVVAVAEEERRGGRALTLTIDTLTIIALTVTSGVAIAYGVVGS